MLIIHHTVSFEMYQLSCLKFAYRLWLLPTWLIQTVNLSKIFVQLSAIKPLIKIYSKNMHLFVNKCLLYMVKQCSHLREKDKKTSHCICHLLEPTKSHEFMIWIVRWFAFMVRVSWSSPCVKNYNCSVEFLLNLLSSVSNIPACERHAFCQ